MGIEARTNEALYCQAISPVLQKTNKQKALYFETRYHKLLGQAWFYHLPASDSKVPGGSECCSPSGYLPVRLWKFSPPLLNLQALSLLARARDLSRTHREDYLLISHEFVPRFKQQGTQQGPRAAVGMAHLPMTALVSGTIPEGSHSCFQCQENLHFW